MSSPAPGAEARAPHTASAPRATMGACTPLAAFRVSRLIFSVIFRSARSGVPSRARARFQLVVSSASSSRDCRGVTSTSKACHA